MNKENLALPISIIIAGIIIAGAVFYTKKQNPPPIDNQLPPQEQKTNGPKEINADDHVLGNPEATLAFVLFTDFECPYCKTFHGTIKQMMDEYGKDGKIKLVLRHFPLDSLHSKSRKEAEATECAADQGGNEKFWQYVDRLFAITPSNDNLDPVELPKIAEYVGLDKIKFEECLNGGKFIGKVQENYQDAIDSGGSGTPYFIIINQKGEKFPVSGALPYQQLKLVINQLLETK